MAEELPADQEYIAVMWICVTSGEEVHIGDKVAVEYASYKDVVAEIRPGSGKREVYCRVVSGGPPVGTLFIAKPDQLLLKMPTPGAAHSCIQCKTPEGR